MKRSIKLLALMMLFLQLSHQASAQCNSNTSICYQGLAGPFAFNQGTPGPPTDFANPTMCSTGLFGNPNGFGFILLYITTSGPLNLLVDGNSNAGFIDVVVYDIPSGVAPCTAVMNSANEIGCNYATSAVGCTQFGNDFGCLSSLPAPFVTAGQVIMIIVHDYSSSSANFTLNLGPTGAQTGPPNAAINAAGPFCISGPTQQLTAVNMGGTWSGPGVSPTGVFNPAAAGIGTHTITYSIGTAPCNSSSTTTVTVTSATVTPPSAVTICQGASTTLTASGATSYTWSPATGLSSTTGATVTASPATTTIYTVTGTTGGCSSSGNVTVTVTPPPTVNVNNATICAGQSATLTATGGTTYTWSPPTGLSSTTGASVTATPAATTTYTVTGSNGGCSATTTSTVTVNPLPVIAVNSPTICAGGSATLTASGATSYTWSPAAGLSSTTGASVTANPTVTTTYTVTGTTAGCTGTATATVTIGPNPVIAVNNATICSGASATLTASGATTYTWSPPAGLSATTGASVTANPTVTTTYTVTGTIGGCSGSTTSTVTIGPSPIVTVNSGIICNGASIVLNATGGTTYTWTPATGLSATTGASVTASPTATTTYTVTGAIGGCSGTANATVTVNPTPTVNVPAATICNGASATLNATGAATYTWSPATGLSATTGTSVTASPTATTTYTVTGTSAAGCNGTTTVTVTVNPLPVVTVPPATICNGGSATLTASGAATYIWSPATGLSATTGVSVTATPAATTTYTINGTSAAGCSSSATTTVTVVSNPVITVNSGAMCSGGSLVLTANGGTTYTWTPATGLSAATGSSVTATPAATTTYTITGSIGGCSGTANATVTVNPNPTVSVPPATICNGASATLNATGAASYNWSPATGLSATTGTSVNASPTATTTYTVTGTSGAGCSGTTTVTVTVNPIPVVNIPSATICNGTTTPLNASGATTYTWSPGTGLSATTGAAVNANPSATTTYTVTGTSLGCSGTGTVIVTVNPVPSAAQVANETWCPGSSVPAEVFASAPAGATFSWENSNSSTGFAQTTGNGDLPAFTSANSGSTALVSNVSVTPTLNGCTGAAMNYTITINPTPVINAVTDVTHCAGESFASIPLSSVPASTLSWTNDNTGIGLDASGSNSVPSFTATNNGIADVSGTVTVSGTLNGCAAVPVTFDLMVSEVPVMSAVNGTTVCNGEMVPGSNLSSNVPGTNYTWVNSNSTIGAPASGNNDLQSFTATNPGTSAITGNFTVTPWSGTCAGQTQSFAITVSPTPVMQPMNNMTECAGQTIPAISPSSNVGQTSYNWTNSNTSIGLGANGISSTSPFIAVNSTTAPVTSTITVTPMAAGCTGAPGTMTITVNPMPIAIAANTGPYCLMADASLSAQSFPNATYSWTGPSAFSSTDQNPAMNGVTAANEGIYNLTVTANGCTSTSSTVIALTPGVPVLITAAGPFCADNGPVQMSVNDYGGTWSGNGVTASGIFDPSQAGAGDVLVIYTPQPGCMITNSTVVTINPMPVIQFAGDDLSGCGPHSVEFTDMTTPANGDLIWNFGDGETATNNGTTEHTYENAGIYTVTLTSTSEGCTSTASMTNYIEVTPPAIADFDILPSSQTTTTDPVFHFTNFSINADTYSWDFGDQSSGSNDEDPSHTYAEEAGSYIVTLIANNEGNCPDTVKRTVSIAEELIFFVPNAFTPDGDEFNNNFTPVFHSGYDPYSFTMYIFNRWGEILFETHDVNIGWDGTYMGELSKEGVYTWKMDFKLSGVDKRVEYVGSMSLLK